MRNETIGDYLVNQGLITTDQLQKVLEVQKEAKGAKKFGDVVVELGYMSEVNFAKALAGNLRVQYVDLDNIDINTEAVQMVPEALARKHTVIAINVQGKRLTVATNDPVNFIVLEDIKVSTGMDTVPVLANAIVIFSLVLTSFATAIAVDDKKQSVHIVNIIIIPPLKRVYYTKK